jgi:hypothetical protein
MSQGDPTEPVVEQAPIEQAPAATEQAPVEQAAPEEQQQVAACPSRKSYPHIAMVQSGKNWRGDDRSAPLDSSS